MAEAAETVDELDTADMKLMGFEGAEYVLYDDDGTHKDYENPANYKTLKL